MQPTSTPSFDNQNPTPFGAPAASPTPMSPQPSGTVGESMAPVIQKTKQFFKQWQFWVMLGLGVFGLVGVVLGVYGLSAKTEADERVARLEAELKEANDLVVKYGTELGIKVNELGRPGNTDKPDTSDKNDDTAVQAKTSDYVYIGEWGIKIKIPNGLKNVSYRFSDILYAADESEASHAAQSVCVSGILDDMAYTPDSFTLNDGKIGFGCLERMQKDIVVEGGSVPAEVKEIGDYKYYYAHPQALMSQDPQEQAWEQQAVELVQNMLSTASNLTAF